MVSFLFFFFYGFDPWNFCMWYYCIHGT
jgi:hypothetical protein